MRLSQDGIFNTIQGEGIHIGLPTVFVRFNGCNMRCEWRDEKTGEVTRCDTPYTSWNKEQGFELTPEEIMNEVFKYKKSNWVSFTGGEPTLQQELPELAASIALAGKSVNVETNGTVYNEFLAENAFLTFSPKLISSVPLNPAFAKLQRNAIQTSVEVIEKYMKLGFTSYQLKFVVVDEKDIGRIHKFITKTHADPNRVVLMPEGIDSTILNERGKLVAELCKDYGFRFTPRLHINLWGNTRRT